MHPADISNSRFDSMELSLSPVLIIFMVLVSRIWSFQVGVTRRPGETLEHLKYMVTDPSFQL